MSSPMSSPFPHADAFGAPIRRDGWQVRAASAREFPALAALRGRAFRGGGEDGDAFDARCLHLWVEGYAMRPGEPLATLRAQVHPEGDLAQGYAAQFFGLAGLARAPGPVLELGRLCVDPEHPAPDAMRLIWAGVTRLAAVTGAARLIGCTSFSGTDPGAFAEGLRLLAARHLGPPGQRPPALAAGAVDFSTFAPPPPGPEAPGRLPPLLRAYLALGGWVGNDLVIDRDLGTSHVFTCVEIAAMPEPRKRLLRALAGEAAGASPLDPVPAAR